MRGLGLRTEGDVRTALGDPRKALRMAQKLLESGWLSGFRVAEVLQMRTEVEQQQNDEDDGDVDTLDETVTQGATDPAVWRTQIRTASPRVGLFPRLCRFSLL